MTGIIISSNINTYKVKIKNKTYNAFSTNQLKKNKLYVGDKVEIEILEDKRIIIKKVLERKNFFIRPRVANIDNAIIVNSTIEPIFNDYFLDKLITFFQFQNVKPILLFTKIDLFLNDEIKILISEYKKMGYIVLLFKNGFDKKNFLLFQNETKNKINVFTGNTGVGKTTIVNSLSKNLNLKTQEISRFLKRGKHTTTNLISYEIFENSFFIDSPGFSIFQSDMNKIDIAHNFLNYSLYLKDCKFSNCLHRNESGCNVRERYSKRKYMNYLKFLDEVKN
ncbi:MAG: putative ribosome biogenesis GTPase RsgA [Candidatus Hepatoplasma vulgare]|nr:MAG: putative ribosome biogenesis GTPase RsgA [Candidatus Hepatoplasma sp.]